MKGVLYIGPLRDMSGYAEAARNYVLSLHKAGVPLKVKSHCFDQNVPDVGSAADREIFRELENSQVDYDVVILHLTPDIASQYAKRFRDKYCINYTAWETSKLHPLWVDYCNQVNEVWVPSAWNVEVFKQSGVTVPVNRIQHGLDINMYNGVSASDFGTKEDKKDFVFLSVLQWNMRKNPEGLLRAYFNAFGPNDNVRLLLKAYINSKIPAHQQTEQLKTVIGKIKGDMLFKEFPKISLVTKPLTSVQMRAMYMYSDAYVTLNFGEGFGLCTAEAGLAGKPVISALTGNAEYMNPDNSYVVPGQWEYVQGMSSFNHWYLGNQLWLRPSVKEAADAMREIYNNREAAAEKGKKLKDNLVTNFNWDTIGAQMVNRLKDL